MSRFTSNPSVFPFEAADTGTWCWAVGEPLIWEVRDALGSVTGEIIAETGFYTDLGSIPRLARWVINPADAQGAKVWILHDKCLQLWGPDRQLEAAGVAHQAMRAVKYSLGRRLIETGGIIAGIDRK